MGKQVKHNDFLPVYPDPIQVTAAIKHIQRFPRIVDPHDVESLEIQLARASCGEAFVIQGGDCAERFSDATRYHVRAKIGSLIQTSYIISQLSHRVVIPIGRIAGQYAKPRSHAYEERDGLTLPSYRGDAVNSHVFTTQGRTPDPQRLIQAVESAQMAYRYVRELELEDFLSLDQAHNWNSSAYQTPEYKEFTTLVRTSEFTSLSDRVYISHEALLPFFEQALTDSSRWNTGAHMLWIGERTRHADSAQMRYAASVKNPIGVKLGPATTADDVRNIVDQLNPEGHAGRLTFIPRMGASRIEESLPPLFAAIRDDGRPVSWMLDPMHGNTRTIRGHKIRFMTDILAEINKFFDICEESAAIPGGLHIEFSGYNVTEIADSRENAGWDHIVDEPLVDPRLNPRQLLHVAFTAGQALARQH
ncbi:3-deoxy-7-phosphoheptulonate synthase [Arcanobacterium phocae]|uniref:3-deoxy-7-phosphoheptulonate synthase n=1 Tax=Arcanobacterium phocae TaxID=131112 RepID=UPI001C0EBB75|nr:3-deoxy-7-phosphoheptulonate synthase [Arcanobacterium phocae]